MHEYYAMKCLCNAKVLKVRCNALKVDDMKLVFS
ncbi:hypothetical protein COLO4_03787 [Corchorus olitorius]|uniref:Uncharacterized protein n=1 Tax=Corchorus olitorius TaxID=93759 RepID=A0A1R3KWN3_9ROSI|nr:hypothetical protein COLO4_03787 [Corchorus olitorius]